MKYRIFNDRIKLIDSSLCKKEVYGRELQRIRNLHPALPLWDRSGRNLRLEIVAHALLYNLGIKREKTKDCDLNFIQKWYEKIGYWILGNIALMVVK